MTHEMIPVETTCKNKTDNEGIHKKYKKQYKNDVE